MSVAEARIRVGFIDCSDRAVLRMCAGYADSDGYSSGSEFGTRLVELKCDGYADHSESASYAGGTAVESRRSAKQKQCPDFGNPCRTIPRSGRIVRRQAAGGVLIESQGA